MAMGGTPRVSAVGTPGPGAGGGTRRSMAAARSLSPGPEAVVMTTIEVMPPRGVRPFLRLLEVCDRTVAVRPNVCMCMCV